MCPHCLSTFTLPYSRTDDPKFCGAPCYHAYRMAHRVATPKRFATCHPDREFAAFDLCATCYSRRHRAQNLASYQASSWRHLLRKRYGMTEADYSEILSAQGGLCAICRDAPEGKRSLLFVDHCHTSKQVRALLCHRCNVLLGMSKDRPAVLREAACYLERFAESGG